METSQYMKTFNRRNTLLGLALAFAFSQVQAQVVYPSRPVRVVVPFPAGSPPDAVARIWSGKLQRMTGQPFIIDNKPGASTIIGTQAAASAPADGYTLLYTVSTTTSINPYVYKKLPYKVEDLVPVSQILSIPFLLIVGQKTDFATTADLLKAAKKAPDALDFASFGIGQATHVAFVKFMMMGGITMTHVPYKDGGMMDVISGQVNASFEPSNTAIPMVTAKRVKALAISTPQRIPELPQIPTVAETIPGFSVVSWQGLFAPKGTPMSVVNLLASMTRKVTEAEDFRAQLRELGMRPVGSGPAEFQQFLKEDAAAWSKVVRENSITAE